MLDALEPYEAQLEYHWGTTHITINIDPDQVAALWDVMR